MTPHVDVEARLVRALISRETREVILFIVLSVAGLAILAPFASAQQFGYDPTNLSFDTSGAGASTVCDQNSSDLGELSSCNSVANPWSHGCDGADVCSSDLGTACPTGANDGCELALQAIPGDQPGDDPAVQPRLKKLAKPRRPDFNDDIFFKNKLEFAFDAGWLPLNVPFPFDFAVGDPYKLYPLRYTLVPVIASLRWHLGGIMGPLILRGNFDFTTSLSVTAIPKGPETHYFVYEIAMRHNFVPRNWRGTPYFDVRVGAGWIDAKGPYGVPFAQGQDFTFTANMGSGVRYNFNPRYAISAGLNYMHISNAGLSEPKVTNFGINVYGPMFGLDIQVHRHPHHAD